MRNIWQIKKKNFWKEDKDERGRGNNVSSGENEVKELDERKRL